MIEFFIHYTIPAISRKKVIFQEDVDRFVPVYFLLKIGTLDVLEAEISERLPVAS